MLNDIWDHLKNPLISGLILTCVSSLILYYTDFSRTFFMIFFSSLISDIVMGIMIKGGDGHAKLYFDNKFQSKGTILIFYFLTTFLTALYVDSQGAQVFDLLDQSMKQFKNALIVSAIMVGGLFWKIHQLYYAKD